MKKLLSITLALCFCSVASADSDMGITLTIAAAKAKVMNAKKKDQGKVKDVIELALADAKKGKEKKETCHENVEHAKKLAVEKGKTLVIWTGITCESHQEVRDSLNDCIHAHAPVDTFGKGLRLVKSDGTYIIHDADIGTKFTPATIKALASKKVNVSKEDCPNGQCNIPSSYVYPSQPVRTYRQVVPSFQGGNCPNGQCPIR
jgi:hypothetical protein